MKTRFGRMALGFDGGGRKVICVGTLGKFSSIKSMHTCAEYFCAAKYISAIVQSMSGILTGTRLYTHCIKMWELLVIMQLPVLRAGQVFAKYSN
jgi:hypothetical protein